MCEQIFFYAIKFMINFFAKMVKFALISIFSNNSQINKVFIELKIILIILFTLVSKQNSMALLIIMLYVHPADSKMSILAQFMLEQIKMWRFVKNVCICGQVLIPKKFFTFLILWRLYDFTVSCKNFLRIKFKFSV